MILKDGQGSGLIGTALATFSDSPRTNTEKSPLVKGIHQNSATQILSCLVLAWASQNSTPKGLQPVKRSKFGGYRSTVELQSIPIRTSSQPPYFIDWWEGTEETKIYFSVIIIPFDLFSWGRVKPVRFLGKTLTNQIRSDSHLLLKKYLSRSMTAL